MHTPQTAASQRRFETHSQPAGGPNFPDISQTCGETQSITTGVGDHNPTASHVWAETHPSVAGGSNFPDTSQAHTETQFRAAGVGDSTSATTSQPERETHNQPAGGGRAVLFDPTIYVLAENVTDLESTRKALDNRIRQLTRCEADKDGEVRGHCLPDDYPSIIALRISLDLLGQAEKSAVKALEKAMKDHPLGSWVQSQNGLGLKTVARLLGAIGDPYWHSKEDRPRRVSELWSYCGLGDAGRQVRRKGVKSNWSDDARMRAWNCVQPIIKNTRSPYRPVYDAAKANYAGGIHHDECKRCGPKGKPAQPGSPLSKAHIDARAQRAVMKAILKDLWCESRRIHEEVAASHSSVETQITHAGGDFTTTTTKEKEQH